MNEPAVLFLCTHNAGRSQMAMGFFEQLAGARAAAYSGGSEPAAAVNSAAVAAMLENGIGISAEQPTRWTPDFERRVRRLVRQLGVGSAPATA